ncbi:putative transcription factor C2H2 family [Dioscorea sansibarensis]
MSSGCPFAKTAPAGAVCPMRSGGDVDKREARSEDGDHSQDNGSETVPAKCPFGYDSHTFKLGPLSCMICKALLFESSRCVPCAHKFCKACISRFKDCPLCGADIDKIEPDSELQITVERFINGHARIKRAQVNVDGSEIQEQKNVIYGDVSMERGAFLVQQAMRAFQAKNVESARSRLSLCAEDIRDQLQSLGNTAELCSQLGAILGMLGDCCRAMGDAGQAVDYYEESVEFLSKVPAKDLELVHTLSVSLNKIGDLKYYDGDLQSARSYYIRSLDVRREAVKENSNVSSQIVDVAVSLAKVADVDRTLKNEAGAINGFQEAVELLESLKLNSDENGLEQRRVSVLDFVRGQIEEKAE